jgi:NAD(P)-dependent dehydrogenase (short-subunit alcohol dehydrogenase family)
MHYVPVEVTDESSVFSGIQQAVEFMGSISFAVNCAGIALAERAVGREGPSSQGRFREVTEVNLIGTFTVCVAAASVMQHNAAEPGGARGVIVNTASIAAFDGQTGLAAYAASKGGVVSMTLPLAREFAAFGVRVVCIAPGVFGTPMTANLPPAVIDTLIAQTPFPTRLGQPAEFASLVCHAYENEMLNGVTLRLDGGLRMH